jgi:hypothetical protein
MESSGVGKEMKQLRAGLAENSLFFFEKGAEKAGPMMNSVPSDQNSHFGVRYSQ